MPPVNRKQPKRAKSSESQFSLMEFMQQFPNDEACLEFLWRSRYAPDGTHAHCPKCDQTREFRRYEHSQQRQAWTCVACGKHLAPTADTIFHKSSTSLHLWFYAMYLMASTRCGISAKQLERELGVTYKTAYRMGQLIRKHLMVQDAEPFKGGQPVEVDESYVGGKQRWIGSGRPGVDSNKTPVLGMVQRKGRVMAMTVPNVKRATVMPLVQERILPRSTVYTDYYHIYRTLPHMGYSHARINHSEKIYVSGDVHTNTIEGFWSLVKRGLDGVFHGVSKKHLQGYLNEYAWRYNHRHEPHAHFQQLLLRAALPL
ncbi:MAG TPA: IS1595 family transposase [Vicinamibacterales bacterium]|nr:IS1595 family transposase [Vicinamibacterales bacterium]